MSSGTLLYVDSKLFLHPKIDGYEGQYTPIYCFLVSHGDRHLVFDLGVRTDWENYAPKVVSLIKSTTSILPDKDVATVLDTADANLPVRSRDIEAVIWSHSHFDHIGNVSAFPRSTDLVIGPGVKAAAWPGYPSNPEALVLDSDIEGRNVHEINFDQGLTVGGFEAFDYFGDGSFYLLNAPGHAIGHMCALARTTVSPPSFVFMGADACHHPGVLRPTQHLPLPQSLINASLTAEIRSPNPPLDKPFCEVSFSQLVFPDRQAAMETVRKIQELDASDNILVVMAHDLSLRTKIPLFPRKINGWEAENLKLDTRWLFCQDFRSVAVPTGRNDAK